MRGKEENFGAETPDLSAVNVSDPRTHKYADILLDWTFKKVFGTEANKDLLMELLNSILPVERRVRDLRLMPTEVQAPTPQGKRFCMDLRCESYDGMLFIIEVQNYYQPDFYRRCVAYSSSTYWGGGRSGEPYSSFMPVYLVALLSESAISGHSFHLPEYDDRIIYHYRMQEKSSGEMPSDTINVIFVELGKFHKSESECADGIERWLFVLKNMSRLDSLPDAFRNEVFVRLFKAVNVSMFSDLERMAYIDSCFGCR